MRVQIRVFPGARRPGVHRLAEVPTAAESSGRSTTGEPLLRVAVAARALEGAATEAALKAVAQALGVRPRQVRLVSGATSRLKLIELELDDDQALALLAAIPLLAEDKIETASPGIA